MQPRDTQIAPAIKPSGTPTAWRVEQRTGSGQYVVSERGAILFRFDRSSGVAYCWDKKLGGEVPVKLTELLALCT